MTNEMVLPANLSKGVQSIIDSNGNTGGGSGNQVHFNISAIDATGFQEHLDKNAGKIYDLFNRGVRTADPRLTKAGRRDDPRGTCLQIKNKRTLVFEWFLGDLNELRL